MGYIYITVIALYALLAFWALRNFKSEVNAIKEEWTKVKGDNPLWIMKHRALRDLWCWILTISIVLLGLTGIGAGISMILSIILVLRILSKIRLPEFSGLFHAILMFSLDFFITTGGAGIISLGAIFVPTGGAIGGVIVLFISNIMSHMFFLPKKTKVVKGKKKDRYSMSYSELCKEMGI